MRGRPPGEWSRWRRRELSLASRRRTRLRRLHWLAEPRPPRVQRRSLPLVLYRKRSRLSVVARLAVVAVLAVVAALSLVRQSNRSASLGNRSLRRRFPRARTWSRRSWHRGTDASCRAAHGASSARHQGEPCPEEWVFCPSCR